MENAATSSRTLAFHVQTIQNEKAVINLLPDDLFRDMKDTIAAKLGMLTVGMKVVSNQKVLDFPDEIEVGQLGIGVCVCVCVCVYFIFLSNRGIVSQKI